MEKLKEITESNYSEEDYGKDREKELKSWCERYLKRLTEDKAAICVESQEFKKVKFNSFTHKTLEWPSEKEILADIEKTRQIHMERVNPKFNLTNTLAQQAIMAAETGDLEEFRRIEKVVFSPFEEHSDLTDYDLDKPKVEAAVSICVSCSS